MGILAQFELRRHEWRNITCGCGKSADHLLGWLESGIGENGIALRALDGHAFIESNLQPPAPAVTAVAMAALSDAQSTEYRKQLLWLLLSLAAGEEDGDSVESSIYWKCHELIRDGLWLVYREVVKAESPVIGQYALEIAEIVEWDEARLGMYRRTGKGF